MASILHILPPRQDAYTNIEIDHIMFAVQFPDMLQYGATGIGRHGAPYTQPTSNSTSLLQPIPSSGQSFQPLNNSARLIHFISQGHYHDSAITQSILF